MLSLLCGVIHSSIFEPLQMKHRSALFLLFYKGGTCMTHADELFADLGISSNSDSFDRMV